MGLLADQMTTTFVPALSNLAPESGAYLNEVNPSFPFPNTLHPSLHKSKFKLMKNKADPQQPDWKTAFYGVNYDTLAQIKRKYDPTHLLYAHTAVESDYWAAGNEGRLCQVDS